MSTPVFSNTESTLEALAETVLGLARSLGATAAEVDVSEGVGQSVAVRLGQIETIEFNQDKDVAVTVYVGDRRGHASTSDFSHDALKSTVAAALTIARYTESDKYAGLADPDLLLKGPIKAPTLFYPKHLSVESMTELALTMERKALGVSPQIRNSDGAEFSMSCSQFRYANTHGFMGGYPSSHFGAGCTVIAGEQEGMQRDHWYSSARDFADLEAMESIGQKAGERTLRRLHARKIRSTKRPVLFEAPVAGGLIGSFVGAVSGGSLYRKTSFLLDSLGQAVFAPHVQLFEDPSIPKGLASGPFDNEGVRTESRWVVRDGVVQGYFLGSYSARKLGLKTTGNAGGPHNLVLSDTGQSFEALIEEMGTGLLVTDLLGHGVNGVTGDYSRGAAGFWVEGGEIAYPVEEITIAGNLKTMFQDIRAIGTDRLVRGSRQSGSILVDGMTIAGE